MFKTPISEDGVIQSYVQVKIIKQILRLVVRSLINSKSIVYSIERIKIQR